MSAEALIAHAAPRPRLPTVWRQPLAVLAAAAAVLVVVFARDWADMAWQWWDSSTYNHILLVPPILGWLVIQRWPELQRLTPSGWWPGLGLFAGGMLLWVLGTFAGFSLIRQAAVVAMLGSTIVTLLGPRVATALAFPLGYMVFLVPFGDELVPLLQTVTAKLTIALVHLSGVPAVIEGVFIDTPAGLFEVAEACSGIKFLIAMIALGVLVGNVCFRSWWRRALFMLVCVVVPVLANGVRAWGTIFAAQSMGAAWAGGFDHIVYGWFFFAIVIALVLAIGWRFFDRPAHAPLFDPDRLETSPILMALARHGWPAIRLVPAMAGMVLAGQVWAMAADRLEAPLPPQIHLPEVPGWHRVDYHPRLWWEPRARGASHRLLGRYADEAGRQVDVFIALYAGQSDGREAGGFGEGALMPESGWAWAAGAPVPDMGKADRLLGNGEVERLAETYYRTGPVLTGSNMRLKLANIADRLLLRERPTMTLILSAERRGGQNADRDPDRAVAAFRSAIGPVDVWMDRVAGLR